MNKMDIDGVKTKGVIQHYQSFSGGSNMNPGWSPNFKGIQTGLLYLLQFGDTWKAERQKSQWENWPAIPWGNNYTA